MAPPPPKKTSPAPPAPPAPAPGPSRPADRALAAAVEAEVGRLRREGQIPIEVRLDPTRWNALSPALRQGPFGGRTALLFAGLPCVLALKLQDPRGFAVRTVAPTKG